MAQVIQIGNMWYSDLRIEGKRIRRALSKYKPEAMNKLQEMMRVRESQKRGDVVQDMSWSYFRETYLKESETDKEQNTFYADRRAFELVDEATHLTKIIQMTPERLNRIRIFLIESKKYTPSTIARSIRGMITAMRWAEDLKYVPMQNWRIVQKKNHEPEGRIDFYERDKFLELMPKLEGKFFTGALVMGRAGLRLGEMVHLQWRDIQWEHKRILFRSKPELNWYIKGDKKKLRKVRIVPLLTNDIAEHLLNLRGEPKGFVLGGDKPIRADVYGSQITEALKATGIKTFEGEFGHPHILRHTFASHLAQIGVDLRKVTAWMGHNSIRMTEKYSHLCPPDALSEVEISKRLCSTFVPVKNSFQLPTTVLGSLDPENGDDNLPSETV